MTGTALDDKPDINSNLDANRVTRRLRERSSLKVRGDCQNRANRGPFATARHAAANFSWTERNRGTREFVCTISAEIRSEYRQGKDENQERFCAWHM